MTDEDLARIGRELDAGHAGVGVLFRPRQTGEILESLAVIGGLLFYFASGPGS